MYAAIKSDMCTLIGPQSNCILEPTHNLNAIYRRGGVQPSHKECSNYSALTVSEPRAFGASRGFNALARYTDRTSWAISISHSWIHYG